MTCRRGWPRCWRGSGFLKVPGRFWSLGLDFGFNEWDFGDMIRAAKYSIDNTSLRHTLDSHLPYVLRAQTSDRFSLTASAWLQKSPITWLFLAGEIPWIPYEFHSILLYVV